MKKFVSPYGATGRRNFVLAVLLVFAGLIVFRVSYLQICDVHFWADVDPHGQKKCKANFIKKQGEERFVRKRKVPAMRGSILDRHGVPLAVSTPVSSIWVNPREIITDPAAMVQLASAIGYPLKKLQKRINRKKNAGFMYVKRGLEPAFVKKIMAQNLTGVYDLREYRRFYPSAEVTSQVIGFNNIDDEGIEGVEDIYNEWLRGKAGSSSIFRDRSNRVVDILEEITAPEKGQGLILTIDKRIQYLTYSTLLEVAEKFSAKSATAVVLDAKTAEILAMVSVPSGNPNNNQEKTRTLLRNRAMTDVFEPGSVVKPFVVAAALEAGLINANTPIDTNPGRMKVDKEMVVDTHNYGKLDVTGVIRKSSNVGACKIALRLPKETLEATYNALGFGQKSEIDFPGESKGILRKMSTMGDFEYCTNAYGYGLSVTALQLAQAYAVLANDGLKVPVSLVKRDSLPMPQRVLSKHSVKAVQQMLAQAVGLSGTGRRATIGDYTSDYRVGGKTGTVHKVIGKQYSEDRYLSVFAGMAPLDNPRLVMVVMVDDPQGDEYYGGLVAAPVFAKVVGKSLRIMGVPPDKQPTKKQVLVHIKNNHDG